MIEKMVVGRGITRVVTLLFILVSLMSSGVHSSTIESRFSFDNINAISTYYTYLKESNLEDSAYSTGFKTKSMNYFKGPEAHLTDRQTYYDGAIDGDHPAIADDHNASVTHTLTVDFIGEKGNAKGISEFLAKGYYTDNRGVSAWKKIWDANDTYPSSNITVRATATMNMKGIYDLKYNAKAENAYAVYSDYAGWSNKTGARRIDWEQSGLMTGEKIDFTNDLRASSAFKPRAPGADWLPCTCLSGTLPPIEPIEGKGSEWPSKEALAVLEPTQKLPNANCSPYGCKPSICKDGKCTSECNLPSCNNFPAVYGYGSATTSSGASATLPELPDVLVESYFVDNKEAVTQYTINVRNLGTTELTDVVVYADIQGIAAYIPGSATIDGAPATPITAKDQRTIAWKVNNLQAETGPSGVKTIVMSLNASAVSEFKREDVKVFAAYNIGTTQENTKPEVSSIGIPEHTAEGV